MEAAHDPGIADVTSGTNTVTFPQGGGVHTVRGWDAVKGYDLASGGGTIDAAQIHEGRCQPGSRPASATTRSSRGASGSSTVAGPNGTSGPLGASGLANNSRNWRAASSTS